MQSKVYIFFNLLPLRVINQNLMRYKCQVVGDTLYVSHGRRISEEGAPISALDLTSWNWTTLRPGGTPPPYPLIYNSSWAFQNRIYIFGGMVLSRDTKSHHLSNQLYYYDISTNRWERPSLSGILEINFP